MKLAIPFLDSDLDDMAHLIADRLEEHTRGPVDMDMREKINDALASVLADFGIFAMEG